MSIVALLALSTRFESSKLLILLMNAETDPVSGHHIKTNDFETHFEAPAIIFEFSQDDIERWVLIAEAERLASFAE